MTEVFIIAEVGSVHDGSFGNACKLIEVAAECGADAVKFQTHIPEAETLPDAPAPEHFKGEPRFSYFKRTGFSLQEWKKLKQHADNAGVEFISSPFSIEAVSLLEEVGIKRHKIPSGEVSNLPLLEAVAETQKPVLLSSGMSNWKELDAAVACIRKYHNNIIVMQCSSAYPCKEDAVGLNILSEMNSRYQLPIGYSDHTAENYAAYAAVTLGAIVIEKHLTFSKRMYGSDAPYAAEPAQFADMVKGIRSIYAMLKAPVDKDNITPYLTMKTVFEKSLVTTKAISKGVVITHDMISAKKPGYGIPTKDIDRIINRKATRDLPANHLLSYDDVTNG